MTINLDTLRKIAEQATPGPWEIDNLDRVVRTPDRGIVHDDSCAGSEEWSANTDAPFIATFDPPTVLALLSRLEQAEQDRVKLRNRLDATRRQRDGYRNQIRKAEQQVARVREFSDQLRGYCSPYGVAHDYAKQLDRALDGDTRG